MAFKCAAIYQGERCNCLSRYPPYAEQRLVLSGLVATGLGGKLSEAPPYVVGEYGLTLTHQGPRSARDQPGNLNALAAPPATRPPRPAPTALARTLAERSPAVTGRNQRKSNLMVGEAISNDLMLTPGS